MPQSRQRVKINELLLICVLTILLDVIIITFHESLLRQIIGILFVLSFPGYTLVAALFPQKRSLSLIERIALSLGLSMILGPLIGLLLNYTPRGITLYSVSFPLSVLTIGLSVIAWHRRLQLPVEDRFTLVFSIPSLLMPKGDVLDKTLSIVLLTSITLAISTLGYVMWNPKIAERYTEFYVIGMEGKAGNYPDELTLGQEGKVILGIVNHEQREMGYKIEIRIDGQKNGETIDTGMIGSEEKWEQEVSFKPEKTGKNQKVEFLLYKQGEEDQPYTSVYIWVNVE